MAQCWAPTVPSELLIGLQLHVRETRSYCPGLLRGSDRQELGSGDSPDGPSNPRLPLDLLSPCASQQFWSEKEAMNLYMHSQGK